jgi:hypothetical protein
MGTQKVSNKSQNAKFKIPNPKIRNSTIRNKEKKA